MSDAPQSAHRAARARRRGELARLALAVVVTGLVVAFVVLNTQDVKVDWIFTTTQTPLIIVILVSLAVGGIMVAAIFRKRLRSGGRRRRQDH